MKKFKNIIAILTAVCLSASVFSGCGADSAQTETPKEETAALSTPTPTPEPPETEPKDERSIEEILNDVLNKRDAEKEEAAREAAAKETPIPEDPFRDTAAECISKAIGLCSSGAKAAEILSNATYDFLEAYTVDKETVSSITDYFILKNHFFAILFNNLS